MSGAIEVQVASRAPETLQAKVDRLVRQRVAELMARKDLALFHPFLESKAITDELRRLQTGRDWLKWRVYYERWGCRGCGTRQERHSALGMCQSCYRQTASRLRTICGELKESSEGAENLIAEEKSAYDLARAAYGREASSDNCTTETPKAGRGRPKMKPTILQGDPGARVRQLRELAGMTQGDLAIAAGVDRKTIGSFERGDHRAFPDHRAAIRKILVEALVRAFWPE